MAGSGLTLSDASGMSGGTVTLGASNLGALTDNAAGLVLQDGSGFTGGALSLAANNLGVTDNAAGLLIQDSGSATGGSITLNFNATSVLDDAQGLAFHNSNGGSRRRPLRGGRRGDRPGGWEAAATSWRGAEVSTQSRFHCQLRERDY